MYSYTNLAHGYDFYGKDPLTYVEELAENLPVVSNKRMTPFQVNPQVSELLNKFEKNIDALDLMGSTEADTETVAAADRTINKAAEQNGERKKRPPPMLIPIAAVIKFSEQGPDSVNLAECLVGTPTDETAAGGVECESTDDSLSERTIPITPLAPVVSQVDDLADEFVEDMPPSESSKPAAAEEEELVVEADPSPPPTPVEKESKKRKVEPAPKVERVKRKRTTMSMKKDED
jgi:hypothetical protein